MNTFGNENRKQLEEQFRSKFENAQFTPPAHLWEQIDAALDEKPWYKRPLVYWTSGLVATLLLVVMFWFTMFYEGQNPSQNTVADKDKIENTISRNPELESKSNSIAQNNTEKNTKSLENNSAQNSVVHTNSISSSSNQTDNNSTSSISNPVQISVEVTKENKAFTPISVDENDVEEQKQDKNTNVINELTFIFNTKKTELTFAELKEMDTSQLKGIEKPVVVLEDIEIKTDSSLVARQNNNPAESPNKTKSGLAIVFGVSHSQGVYQPNISRDSIHSGLNVLYTSLEERLVEDNLADTLPQSNLRGVYQQTGFDIALQFGKRQRWSFNTGLNLGQSNYAFSSDNYLRGDTVLVGNPLVFLPDNKVEVRYEWVQIPIALGYQFGETRAKNVTGFAQLGASLEFMNQYSYTSEDSRFEYSLGNHNTTNTYFWSQVGLNYHLTNRWNIWAGGTYRSSLSSLIAEDGVTFSSQSYGWQVGTRFTIFKTK